MVLCGVRDVRDYRIHSSSENAEIVGGSAFNVRAESLRIGDFTGAEVRTLQLLLQSFLQRVVNSGGRIEREYGLGRGRTDLLILWPRGGEGAGPGAEVERHVVECKVLHGSLERTIAEGLSQTAAYVDRCAGGSGHLVIFDRSEGKRWEEKVFRRDEVVHGRRITVWGM